MNLQPRNLLAFLILIFSLAQVPLAHADAPSSKLTDEEIRVRNEKYNTSYADGKRSGYLITLGNYCGTDGKEQARRVADHQLFLDFEREDFKNYRLYLEGKNPSFDLRTFNLVKPHYDGYYAGYNEGVRMANDDVIIEGICDHHMRGAKEKIEIILQFGAAPLPTSPKSFVDASTLKNFSEQTAKIAGLKVELAAKAFARK